MIRIPVEASRKYDVIIERGLLGNAGKYAADKIVPCKALIITDDIVDAIYGDSVEVSFLEAGFTVRRYVFTHGERSKNMHTILGILEFAADNRFTRSDLFVALGGGIAGDIAGMAAAIYLRGVAYIQIPTTLLAAIDSSVGGKTGVNLSAGKNLAGAFWQPSMVLCDYSVFNTLPAAVYADGVAEAIKYGMISDLELFELFESGPVDREIERIISRCINIKRKIVFHDEFDRGTRQLLNFGHTFGHAIEKCSGYEISHGHAVAVGMVMISKAAESLGLAREKSSDRLAAVLDKHNLPTSCPFDADQITAAVLGDKKRMGDVITVVIPIRPGKCQLHPVPVGEVRRLVFAGLGREGS